MATEPGLRSRDGADPEEKSAGKFGRVAHGLNLSDRAVLVKLEAAKRSCSRCQSAANIPPVKAFAETGKHLVADRAGERGHIIDALFLANQVNEVTRLQRAWR